MAINEKLTNRIREALVDQKKVEEKIMFRGICFMVNGKMCVCASADEMMCRIDPAETEQALERDGIRGMIRNGKTMKGYVYVNEDAMKSKRDFDYWVNLSLAFNDAAKSSKKKIPAKASAKKKSTSTAKKKPATKAASKKSRK